MTKAELIARVASRKDLPRDLTKKAVSQIIEAVFTEIGDYFIRSRTTRTSPARLTYPGFGTFSKRRRGPRMVRNPQNGTPITIPSQATLVFAPGKELKELLNTQTQRVGGRG
jgi:nucleoid DNA-binding protein